MKVKPLFILLLASLFLVVACDKDDDDNPVSGGSSGNVYVNELLASNDNANADENDEYDDWIEIWNDTDQAVDIGGYYITDSFDDPEKWQIPSDNPTATTIEAGGFLILWADEQTDQGPLHVDIKLSAGGEEVGLYTASGGVVDEVTFGPQTTDISYGRYPDGSSEWTYFSPPTPGDYNTGEAPNQDPVIDELSIDPSSPLPNDVVTVTAVVFDEETPVVTLYYRTDATASYTEATMTAVDGEDYTYSATIAGQAEGTTVEYYVYAEDTEGLSVTDPEDAPTTVYSYTAQVSNYTLPLYINEILASNDGSYGFEYNGETYYEDWVEIYNAGDEAIDLGGMYVTDDLTDSRLCQIPTTDAAATTVPAGGYLILWADKMEEAGAVHLSDVKLSADGEAFGLFAADAFGNVQIDAVTFGAQTPDTSYGRTMDGGDTWDFFNTPTPGATNGN